MFDQSFIQSKTPARNSLSFTLSLILQCVAVCLALLFSIATAQRLPPAQIKALVLAPKTPASPALAAKEITPEASRTSVPIRRVFIFTPLLHTPRVRALPGTPLADAAPDLGSPSGTIDPNAIPLPNSTSYSVQPVPPPETKPQVPVKPSPPRISEGVAAANLIRKVLPEYPKLARDVRVEGIVHFRALINENGQITNLELLSGHPLLVPAARAAVLEWRFRPTLLNGRPIAVVTEISVNFKLGTGNF